MHPPARCRRASAAFFTAAHNTNARPDVKGAIPRTIPCNPATWKAQKRSDGWRVPPDTLAASWEDAALGFNGRYLTLAESPRFS